MLQPQRAEFGARKFWGYVQGKKLTYHTDWTRRVNIRISDEDDGEFSDRKVDRQDFTSGDMYLSIICLETSRFVPVLPVPGLTILPTIPRRLAL